MSIPEEQRIVLEGGRLQGQVLEVLDGEAWLRPTKPIDHPEAELNDGRIFVRQAVCRRMWRNSELSGVGTSVSFIPYADGEGIGAMDVRPAAAAKGSARGKKAAAKARAQAAAPRGGPGMMRNGAGGGARGKQQGGPGGLQEGTLVDWRGRFGFIRAAEHIPGTPDIYVGHEDIEEELTGVGATVSFVLFADDRGMRAAHVKPSRGRGGRGAPSQPHGPPPGFGGRSRGGGSPYGMQMEQAPPNLDKVGELVHTALTEKVWEAVEPLGEGIDETWPLQEMNKRVVRYLYKGVPAAEILAEPFPKAVKAFIESAVSNYNRACSEKPWFADLDLCPAVCAAAWEVAQASPRFPPVTPREIQELATLEYDHAFFKTKFDTAVWDTVKMSFEDGDEKLHAKLHRALAGSFEKALEAAKACTRETKDLKRVEAFLKHWMEDAMCRVWRGIEDPENTLTEATVANLFQNLAAPNGEDDPFSCIPPALISKIGRPPRTWAFYKPTIRALFASWEESENRPSKKAKKAAAAEEEEENAAVEAEEEPPADDYGEPLEEEPAAMDEDGDTYGAEPAGGKDAWVRPKKTPFR